MTFTREQIEATWAKYGTGEPLSERKIRQMLKVPNAPLIPHDKPMTLCGNPAYPRYSLVNLTEWRSQSSQYDHTSHNGKTRPREAEAKIDPEHVKALAGAGCTVEEIADFLSVNKKTLERRFLGVMEKGRRR
jgi:hypothetical protein